MAFCAILAGCGNHSNHGDHNHDHEAEAHEEHEHEHGHNHSGEACKGHNHEHEHSHGEADGHEDGHGHDGEIEVSLERQKTFGITTDTVAVGDFNEVIHTSGQILSAMGDEMTVVAKSSGVVSFGKLAEGSAVGKGSLIATISSKELGGGDQLAKVKATYEAAKKEYERDIQLSKDNIVSESHLDQS